MLNRSRNEAYILLLSLGLMCCTGFVIDTSSDFSLTEGRPGLIKDKLLPVLPGLCKKSPDSSIAVLFFFIYGLEAPAFSAS